MSNSSSAAGTGRTGRVHRPGPGGAVELLVEQLAVRSRLGERLVVGEVDDVLLDVGLGRGRVAGDDVGLVREVLDERRRQALVISSADASTASVPAVARLRLGDGRSCPSRRVDPKYAAASRHASVQTPHRGGCS